MVDKVLNKTAFFLDALKTCGRKNLTSGVIEKSSLSLLYTYQINICISSHWNGCLCFFGMNLFGMVLDLIVMSIWLWDFPCVNNTVSKYKQLPVETLLFVMMITTAVLTMIIFFSSCSSILEVVTRRSPRLLLIHGYLCLRADDFLHSVYCVNGFWPPVYVNMCCQKASRMILNRVHILLHMDLNPPLPPLFTHCVKNHPFWGLP